MGFELRPRPGSATPRRSIVLAGLACVLLANPAASSARPAATSVTAKVLTAGGSIRSTPTGIDCPATCSAVFTDAVKLTAAPIADWRFDHWENDCATETSDTCTVPAGASVVASAVFSPVSVLKVYVSGAGRVTSSPPGIDPVTGKAASASCNALTRFTNDPGVPQADTVCEVGYRPGQKVTLTAQGIGGFAQQTWSRYDCQVGKPCTVTMDEPGTTVGATFAGALLGVVVEGGGRVTSSPAGIDCGTTCLGGFSTGTKVRLTATPGADPFVEWSGGCAQAPTCDVTVDMTKIAAAGFGSPVTMTIPNVDESADVSVDLGGLGAGSVTVAGPKSGTTTCTAPHCTKRFGVPELVTFTGTPASPGSRFGSWLGGCPPTAPSCQVDTQFVTGVAACFAPVAPPDGLGVVRVVKSHGARRLTVAIRASAKAAKLTMRLVRPGSAYALPAVKPSSLPKTVSFPLPRSLRRGTYSLRASVSDPVGCQGTLKARQVVVPLR